MCHCPTTDNPLGLFRLLFILLLWLIEFSDLSLRRREDLRQEFTEKLRLLLLEPPSDQVQMQHATHSFPIFEHQAVQTQALLDPLEKQLNGIIVNNKFCMSRIGRLQLSWWRLPLHARTVVSKEVESPCEDNKRERCSREETHEKTTMDGSASDGGVS